MAFLIPLIMVQARRGQCLFNRPSALDSILNQRMVHIQGTRPLVQRHSFSIIFEVAIFPCVRGLLKWCRPATIAPFIVSIIVDAIQRMLRRWSWSHITVERLKRRRPLFGHSDSSATISWPRFVAWYETAAFGVTPCLIGWALGHAMGAVHRAHEFTSQTATAFGAALCEARTNDGFLCATVTLAEPCDAQAKAAFIWGSRHYCEPSKALADQRDQSWHNAIIQGDCYNLSMQVAS